MEYRLLFRGLPTSPWGYRIIRWIYGALFIYAGINKLMDPDAFAVVIEAFGLVPESWIMPTALGLPVLEIIAGFALMFDIRGSLSVVTGLLVFFIAVVGYGIWLGLDIDCGCFGPEDPEAEVYAGLRPALYRNLMMMAGILYLYFWRFSRSEVPVRIKIRVFFEKLLYHEEG